MQLAARLTLLNAFINNGSVLSQYLDMKNGAMMGLDVYKGSKSSDSFPSQ